MAMEHALPGRDTQMFQPRWTCFSLGSDMRCSAVVGHASAGLGHARVSATAGHASAVLGHGASSAGLDRRD